MLEKSKEEIEEEIAQAVDIINEEGTKYPGMSYEEGVRNALDWVLGVVEEAPISDA